MSIASKITGKNRKIYEIKKSYTSIVPDDIEKVYINCNENRLKLLSIKIYFTSEINEHRLIAILFLFPSN